jgi:hypothetical protein
MCDDYVGVKRVLSVKEFVSAVVLLGCVEVNRG